MNWYDESRLLYFAIFFLSAWAATAPGSHTAELMLEGAKVSLHVASHTSNRPLDHGMMDIPFGLLPSSHDRPVGSSLDGIFAETSEGD